MKNRRYFHLKEFVIPQALWALLCSAFGFLFILLQSSFQSPYLLTFFVYSWWGWTFLVVCLAILLHGGLSRMGVNIEFNASKWINTKIVNKKIDPKITNNDLKKIFYILKKKPTIILITELAFIGSMVTGILISMFFVGASLSALILIFIGGLLAFCLLAFFSLFYEEQICSQVLKDCRKKIKNIGLNVTEDHLSSLRYRFNYFIILFFLLLIIILSFAHELNILLWLMIIFSFVAVIAINEMIAQSIYSFFEGVKDFAEQLSLNKGVRFFPKDYYMESAVIAKNLNNSAYKLDTSSQVIEEERQRSNTIIVNFSDPIIFINDNNELTFFNSAAGRFLGLQEDDFGKKISGGNNFSLNNFKKLIRKKEYTIKEAGEIEGYKRGGQVLHIKSGQEEKIFKIITRKVYGKNNNYYGVLKIFNDLTREDAMNKLKSEFVSEAAHQLRTPLSAIKWILKMILDEDVGGLNKEQEEFMEKGYKSTEREIYLVENLLYVSRIEEGRFGYDLGDFNFLKVIDDGVEKVENQIDKKDLSFKIDKPTKLPNIYGDPQKLEMALYYILDNAVKYTPQSGTISLIVKWKKQEESLEVKIKDNGVGIPEEAQDKLFSKFYRAANVLRLQTGGNGLGLFIVRSIIEKHGGEVDIKSEEGKGTEVSFVIPTTKNKTKNR